MSHDESLRLTTYFGERDRAGDRALADALLALYGERHVRTSVLLRGAEGFGRLHHLRTDRLLSLSEDAPVVSIAVDRRTRIEALLDPVREITRRGLITLERTRQLTAEETGDSGRPEEPAEATQLTVYVGRREQAARAPAYVAVCDLLYRRGIAGASVLLGVDGTLDGQRRRARFLARNGDVPMMIVAVGAGDRIARVLPELAGLLNDPLVTLERVQVYKRDGERLATPRELPSTDAHGLAVWQKLSVYTSQDATHDGRPLNLEIIRRLRSSDSAGATSLRGIWGFHGDHAPHGDRFLQVRRHVPVVTITVDTPENIRSSFAIIDELTAERGLVTSETVPAMTALSDDRIVGGLTLAGPDVI